MALSWKVPTHRLINQWPLVMSEALFLFNQATGTGDGATLGESGSRIYTQLDRDAIAEGLVEALEQGEKFLQFFYRPRYVVDEIVNPRWQTRLYSQELETEWKYLKAFGTRATTLIEAGVTCTPSHPDAAGINQKMTISVVFASADDIPDLEEIQVFFQVADGAPQVADEDYEIEPLEKTVSGVTVTLIGHRGLFVQPSIWEQPYDPPNFNSSLVNYAATNDDSDFVSAVDIYRVYPDSTGAIQYQIDPITQCCSSDLSGYTTQNAVGLIVDPTWGKYRVRLSAGTCPKYPIDNIKVSYLAGYPLDRRYRPDWSIVQALIRLGNSYMPVQPVTFSDQRERFWVEDRKVMTDNVGRLIGDDSPFGPLIGQVRAYKALAKKALLYMGDLS